MNEKEFDLSDIAEEIAASNKQAAVDMVLAKAEPSEYKKYKDWFDFSLNIYNIIENKAPYQNLYYEQKIKLIKNLWEQQGLSTQPASPRDTVGGWYHQLVNVKFRAFVKATFNLDLPEKIDGNIFVELALAREKLEQHESRILFNAVREAIEKFKKDNQFVYARQNHLSNGALELLIQKILDSCIILEFLDEKLSQEKKKEILTKKLDGVKSIFDDIIILKTTEYIVQKLKSTAINVLDNAILNYNQNLLSQREEQAEQVAAQEEEKKQAKIKPEELVEVEMIKPLKEEEPQEKLKKEQKKIELQEVKIDWAKKTNQAQEDLVEEKQKIVKDDDEIHLVQDKLEPAQHEESGVHYEEFSVKDVESLESLRHKKLTLITGSLVRDEARTPEEMNEFRKQVLEQDRLRQQIEEAEAKAKTEALRKEAKERENKYIEEQKKQEKIAEENKKKRQEQKLEYQRKLDEKYALDEKRETALTDIRQLGDRLVADKAMSAEDKKQEFVAKYQSCFELFKEDNQYADQFQLIVNKFSAIFNQNIQLENERLVAQEKKEREVREAKEKANRKIQKIEKNELKRERQEIVDEFTQSKNMSVALGKFTSTKILAAINSFQTIELSFNVIQEALEVYKNDSQKFSSKLLRELILDYFEVNKFQFDKTELKMQYDEVDKVLCEWQDGEIKEIRQALYESVRLWYLPLAFAPLIAEITEGLKVMREQYNGSDFPTLANNISKEVQELQDSLISLNENDFTACLKKLHDTAENVKNIEKNLNVGTEPVSHAVPTGTIAAIIDSILAVLRNIFSSFLSSNNNAEMNTEDPKSDAKNTASFGLFANKIEAFSRNVTDLSKADSEMLHQSPKGKV